MKNFIKEFNSKESNVRFTKSTLETLKGVSESPNQLQMTPEGMDPVSVGFRDSDLEMITAHQELLVEKTERDYLEFLKKSNDNYDHQSIVDKGLEVCYEIEKLYGEIDELISNFAKEERVLLQVKAGLRSHSKQVGRVSFDEDLLLSLVRGRQVIIRAYSQELYKLGFKGFTVVEANMSKETILEKIALVKASIKTKKRK